MDKKRAKASTLALGKSLIKSKKKYQNASISERHRQHDEEEQKDYSVTENTSLEEFLNTAQMQDKQFVAEKQDIKIINSEAFEAQNSYVYDESLEEELLIPRRPNWDTKTTPEELHAMENDNYLRWRRKLAQLQERDDIILTPFEKNLEFWRQLWRVIERSDILVQILDARNPLMFHCEDLDKYIKEVDSQKISVILLNKSDYLTETQRKQWLDYFHSQNKIAVFFSALEQTSIVNIEVHSESEQDNEDVNDDHKSEGNKDKEQNTESFEKKFENLSTFTDLHAPLSYEELVMYFKSLKNKLNVNNNSITVGLVGYPNVGKSSTINALLRTKKVSVSAMPGKTKHFQTIILDEQLTICDCPGLVFPNVVSSKSEMIINGILPIDQMKDALSPVDRITSKIPGHVFESLYGIILPKKDEDIIDENRKVSGLDLLSAYGYSRGFMTQRGLPDTSRAARYILKDFVTGRLLFCYSPPNIKQEQFHVYERKAQSKPITDKKLIKVFEGNCLKSKDFDEQYFSKHKSDVHTKGHGGIANHSRQFIVNEQMTGGQIIQNGVREKPWRKHTNRNKKEKLRRVYAHLDE